MSTQTIKLDIVPQKDPPHIRVTEYDRGAMGWTIQLQLCEGENTFTPPSGMTAKIEGTTKGGTGFSVNASLSSGGIVSTTLTDDMTAFKGSVWCKVKLLNGTSIQNTCGFWLDCDRAGVESETIIGADGFEQQIVDAVYDYLDENGQDAVSPQVTVTAITGGHRVTITDSEHPNGQTFDVMDGEGRGSPGYSPYINVQGYWVYWDENTDAWKTSNYKAAGVSPAVTVADISGGHRITITDSTGSHVFDVMDGEDGSGGGSGNDDFVLLWKDESTQKVFRGTDEITGSEINALADTTKAIFLWDDDDKRLYTYAESTPSNGAVFDKPWKKGRLTMTIAASSSLAEFAWETPVISDFYNDAGYITAPTVTTVSGTTPQIAAVDNTIYKCGEVSTLEITSFPATGSFSVIFTSGSTATTLTVPQALIMPDSFAVEANKIYELNVMDGRALTASWTVSS